MSSPTRLAALTDCSKLRALVRHVNPEFSTPTNLDTSAAFQICVNELDRLAGPTLSAGSVYFNYYRVWERPLKGIWMCVTANSMKKSRPLYFNLNQERVRDFSSEFYIVLSNRVVHLKLSEGDPRTLVLKEAGKLPPMSNFFLNAIFCKGPFVLTNVDEKCCLPIPPPVRIPGREPEVHNMSYFYYKCLIRPVTSHDENKCSEEEDLD